MKMTLRIPEARLAALLLCLAAASASHRAAPAAEIQVEGSERFKTQVIRALELLKRDAPEAFAIVENCVARIEQGEHSGMWAYRVPATYEMTETTAFYSVTWCASAIAHDSMHAKLYRDRQKGHPGLVPDHVWVGEDAEKLCLRHQTDVLTKLAAPKHEIDYCRNLKGTHHDVNRDGRYDWNDHKGRKW